MGRATTFTLGPLMLNDARTGQQVPVAGTDGGLSCTSPRTVSPRGFVAYQDAHPVDGRCTRLVIAGPDGTVRRTEQLTPDDFNDERWLATDDDADFRRDLEQWVGTTDEVVVIADGYGGRECIPLDAPGVVEDAACRDAVEELVPDVLDDLVLPDGTPVPVAPNPLPMLLPQGDAEQVPENHRSVLTLTEDVVLVSAVQVDGDDEQVLVRAHDRRTGETLWQRDGLEHAPETLHWSWTETYASTPSGLVHVTYDYADGYTDHPSEDVEHTMRLTEVDPRTGRDGRTVATVRGALLGRVHDDVLVAHTDEKAALRSTVTGYRLPTW